MNMPEFVEQTYQDSLIIQWLYMTLLRAIM